MIRGGSYQAVLSLGDKLFEELELLVTYCDQGSPECQVINFKSKTIDIVRIEKMKKKL